MSIKIADRFFRKDTSGSAEEVFLDIHQDVLRTKEIEAVQVMVDTEEGTIDLTDALDAMQEYIDTVQDGVDNNSEEIETIKSNIVDVTETIKAVYEEINFSGNQNTVDLTAEPDSQSGIIKIVDLTKTYDAITIFLKVGDRFLEGKTILNPMVAPETTHYVNFSFLENNYVGDNISTSNTINMTLGFRVITSIENGTSFQLGVDSIRWTRLGIVGGNLRYEVHDDVYVPIDSEDGTSQGEVKTDFEVYKVFGITAY